MRSMKTGADYIHSPEKRAFDIAAASILMPAARAAQAALMLTDIRGIGGRRFSQERVGANGQPIAVSKLHTLHQVGDQVVAINKIAAKMRQAGLDELIQASDILRGTMSMTGPRPLIDGERAALYERVRENGDSAVVDQHLRGPATQKPGVLGTFQYWSHLGLTDEWQKPETRLEMEIEDFERASFAYDRKLFELTFRALVTDKFTNGTVRPAEHVERLRHS